MSALVMEPARVMPSSPWVLVIPVVVALLIGAAGSAWKQRKRMSSDGGSPQRLQRLMVMALLGASVIGGGLITLTHVAFADSWSSDRYVILICLVGTCGLLLLVWLSYVEKRVLKR